MSRTIARTAHAPFATRRPYRATLEGVRAGAIAAAAVAGWFLVADLYVGAPLVTPARLGAAVASLAGLASVAGSTLAAVSLYTMLHVVAFAALGVAAAWVTHLARREPTVLAAALLFGTVVEVAFVGALAIAYEATLTGTLTWSQIAVGNVVGMATLVAVLRHAHPELRGEIADALGAGERRRALTVTGEVRC